MKAKRSGTLSSSTHWEWHTQALGKDAVLLFSPASPGCGGSGGGCTEQPVRRRAQAWAVSCSTSCLLWLLTPQLLEPRLLCCYEVFRCQFPDPKGDIWGGREQAFPHHQRKRSTLGGRPGTGSPAGLACAGWAAPPPLAHRPLSPGWSSSLVLLALWGGRSGLVPTGDCHPEA